MKANYMYLNQENVLVKTDDFEKARIVADIASCTIQTAEKDGDKHHFCILSREYLPAIKKKIDITLMSEPTFTIDDWNVNQLVTFICSLKMSLNNPVLADIHPNLKEWHEKALKKLTLRE